ncbi:MAG: DNA-processing protein DprA [Bacteroidota bacterium]
MTDADSGQEQRALIALSMVPGVGAGRLRALVAELGSAVAVLGATRRQIQRVPGIGRATAEAIAASHPEGDVEAQLRRAEQVEADLVPAWSDTYPARLREIYDAPAFLWQRGTLGAADDQSIAIVGTRRPSRYGLNQARQFAAELVRQGFTVVSGLAYGIDAAAHEGALDAGGRTLAVLGSGVDRIYPHRHVRLAHRILEAGALLSECALGAAPDAPNFPRRNRIVSGLTLGTLVVEAYEAGGALITARCALEQNREVFACPGDAGRPSSAGTNQLIQHGHAKLVQSVDDILDELLLPSANTAKSPAPAPDLPPNEQLVWDALTDVPIHLDVLCRTAGIDPSTALVRLLSLEFKGLVQQLGGKQFCRL